MEKSKHVMLIGPGAEKFSKEVGLDIVDPSYFRTPERWQEHLDDLKQVKESRTGPSAKPETFLRNITWGRSAQSLWIGTAIWRQRPRRAVCRTSGSAAWEIRRSSARVHTPTTRPVPSPALAIGEYFIRLAVSHSIVALMKYKGLAVEQSRAESVVRDDLGPAGGRDWRRDCFGSQKAISQCPITAKGLYRGYVTKDGKVTVLLYEK